MDSTILAAIISLVGGAFFGACSWLFKKLSDKYSVQDDKLEYEDLFIIQKGMSEEIERLQLELKECREDCRRERDELELTLQSKRERIHKLEEKLYHYKSQYLAIKLENEKYP